MTQDNSKLDDILSNFEVDILELVGDEFAPKQQDGSSERRRLLGLISDTYKLKAQAKQEILKDYISKEDVLRAVETEQEHNRQTHGLAECKSCNLAERLIKELNLEGSSDEQIS